MPRFFIVTAIIVTLCAVAAIIAVTDIPALQPAHAGRYAR